MPLTHTDFNKILIGHAIVRIILERTLNQLHCCSGRPRLEGYSTELSLSFGIIELQMDLLF